MAAAEVLQLLATSSTKLSDALRQAVLLPEVRNDSELSAWIEHEISGYPDSDVPEYRRHTFDSVGDANNGAWLHRGVTVPVHTFSQAIQNYATQPTSLVQSVGTLEGLLASGDGGEFGINWKSEALGLLNYEIGQGGTGVDNSYHFDRVHWQIPRALVQEILEIVRHRALTEITKRVDPEELTAKIAEELPAAPAPVAVQGNANQIIVGSPGASATLTVDTGDWPRLADALASLGIDADSIEELHALVDDDTVDEGSKVMRALDWSSRAAAALGVSTIGSAAASLILQYLGLVS